MGIIAKIKSPKSNADKVMLVRKMYFCNNDIVKKGDELIDLETSKTAIILDAVAGGFVEYKVQIGESIAVGDVIIYIHDKPFHETLCSKKNKGNLHIDNKIISFSAESYIKENDIDISSIKKNFITLSDVNKSSLTIEKEPRLTETRYFEHEVKVVKKPIGLAKKLEIDMLSNVQLDGLVSTVSVNVKAIKIEKNASLFSDSSDSYLPIIIYETSRLLKKYPILNSYFQNSNIYEYVDINIGLALDIDDGLKVYSIRSCNNLTLARIKELISEGVYHYLRRDLTVESLSGSTFTVTDLSQYGVGYFTPLVNNMQSAILGISAIDRDLNRFSLILSFDHRVTEGKIASKFLSELSKNIENSCLKQLE